MSRVSCFMYPGDRGDEGGSRSYYYKRVTVAVAIENSVNLEASCWWQGFSSLHSTIFLFALDRHAPERSRGPRSSK